MTSLTESEMLEKLQALADIPWHNLKGAVAEEALDYHSPKAFFQDLAQHGCVSGMVGSLVYYCDTHAFFDHHYAEIEDIRCNWEEETGQPVVIDGDLKNHLAWFAFEYVSDQLARELEII